MDRKRVVHHSGGRDNGRAIVSFIMAFLLSIVLVAWTSLLLVQFGCFTDHIFLRLIDREYYNYVLSDIEESAVDYTLPTGIGITVVDNTFTLEEVERDVKGYVSAAYRGREFTPDVTAQREALTANVRKFYEDNGAEITAETEEIIQSYVDEIMEVYTYGTRMPGLDLIMEGKAYFSRIFPVGIIACTMLAMVLILLIIRIHHWPHRGLRYVVYAFGATALMLFALPCFLLVTKTYTKVSLSPQYFYHLVVSYLRNLLVLFTGTAVFWLCAAVILMIIVYIMRENIQRRHGRHID